jgi:hypothetical protein
MSTFSRVENGHDMALTTALDLLRWVGTPDAQPPTATAMQPPPAGIGQDGPDQTEPQEKP